MQLAGVVGVGVERGYWKGDVVAVDANPLPVERGGDLQRDARERGFAVVADGEERADGDLLLGGAQMDVQIEGGEGDGLALGVFGGGAVAIWMPGWAAAGPVWVVVWPFSSVEREKMTWPLGCWAGRWPGSARGGGSRGLRRDSGKNRAMTSGSRCGCQRSAARENFMSPGLSVSLVWTRRPLGASGGWRWRAALRRWRKAS